MRTFACLAVLAMAPGGSVESRAPVVAPGGRGTLSLTIVERAEPDLPLRVLLEAPEGLSLLENRLDWSHVVDREAALPRLEGRFLAPAQPGTFRVNGRALYYVCDEEWCRLRDVPISITVEVVAPDPGESSP